MAFTKGFNPIEWVGNPATQVKAPSSYSFEWEDVSKSSAGRTEDGTMHKERIGHVMAYNLKWNALTYAEMSQILTAFAPEYLNVRLIDPKSPAGYVTKYVYVGNRSGALFNTNTLRWENLSFKIIEVAVEN